MSVTTFKVGKSEFAIVPRRRYEQLTRAEGQSKAATPPRKKPRSSVKTPRGNGRKGEWVAYEDLTPAEQDQLDSEIARKALKEVESGKMKTITLEEARRRWGV